MGEMEGDRMSEGERGIKNGGGGIGSEYINQLAVDRERVISAGERASVTSRVMGRGRQDCKAIV
jgi:hypothetical protein